MSNTRGVCAGCAYAPERFHSAGGDDLDHRTSGAAGVTRRERLQQLDLRLSKTFRVDRLTIAPTLEADNVLNSDKIFGHQSANYANASGTYLVPSTILLGRVIGLGASVRW